MSKEITSLNAIEYFEEQQCLAFFNIPQNLEEEDQGFQGTLSYQKNNISFSFLLEGMEAVSEVTRLSIRSKYTTLYIMTNEKRYTIYNSIHGEHFSFSLGHPTTLTLQYE